MYELISRAFGPAPVKFVGRKWDDDWDWDVIGTSADLSNAGRELGPAEAAIVAAAQSRRDADTQVGARHIIFIRHAQPEGDGGSGKKPLSATGEHQAELTGKRLKLLFDEVRAVYHSGVGEARQTAEVIHRHLGKNCAIFESALLAEGVPTIPSPSPEALSDLPPEDVALDGARAEGAFSAHVWTPTGEHADRNTVEVVVGHGNVIRYLVCRALQLSPSAWSRLAANHCAVSWLVIDCEGGVTMREFGGVGHLPPDLVTYH